MLMIMIAITILMMMMIRMMLAITLAISNNEQWAMLKKIAINLYLLPTPCTCLTFV